MDTFGLIPGNAGGAWDNARKFIDMGQFGGQSSDPHKAAVVCDTAGDPFKDTASPFLHVLIKLLCTVSFVIALLDTLTFSFSLRFSHEVTACISRSAVRLLLA